MLAIVMKLPKRMSAVSSRWVSLCLLFLLTVTVVAGSTLPSALAAIPDTVTAADKATWVNNSTISYGGQLFVDSDPTDDNYEFKYNLSALGLDACPSTLKFNVNPYSDTGGKSAIQHIRHQGSLDICHDTDGGDGLIQIGSQDNRLTTSDGGTIDGNGNVTGADPDLECDIEKNPLTWLLCPIAKSMQSAVGKLDNQINALLSIDTSDYFGENGRASGTCSDSNIPACYYKAWSVFRGAALAILVIAGLVMVISQALGFELLDAYTIRKVLPRLLIAVIGISLSWYIVVFLIQFFNDLGNGMRAIIYTPFSGLGAIGVADGWAGFATYVIGTTAFLSLGVLGLLSLMLTAFLAVLVAFFLLILREVAILFLAIIAPLAIAFYILPNTNKIWKFWWGTFSKLLLMFPVIAGFIATGRVFAQVASASADGTTAFVPNFNSLFAHLAVGDLSATTMRVIALIAYFAPYFMIPTAFRLAGGTIATVAGIANDRTKGGFDRLKNYRSNKSKENRERMAYGQRFNNSTGIGRGINTLTGGAATIGSARSKTALLRRGGWAQQRALRAEVGRRKYADSIEGKVSEEDDDLNILRTFSSARQARQEIAQRHEAYRVADANDPTGFQTDGNGNFVLNEQMFTRQVAKARTMGWSGSKAEQEYAMRRLADTGTGYKNAGEMISTIERVTAGNEEARGSAAGYINYVNGAKGRNDLKGGAGGLIGAINRVHNAREGLDEAGNAVAGIDGAQIEANTRTQIANESHALHLRAATGNKQHELTGGKQQGIVNTTEAVTVEMQRIQQRLDNRATLGLNANQVNTEERRLGELTALVEGMRTTSVTYGTSDSMAQINRTTSRSVTVPVMQADGVTPATDAAGRTITRVEVQPIRPIQTAREFGAVDETVGQVVYQRDPATGNMTQTTQQVVNPELVRNPTRNANVNPEAEFERSSRKGPYDRDPRMNP